MMNMTGGGRVGKPITYFVRGDFYDDDDDANDDDDNDDDGNDDSNDAFTHDFTHNCNSRCFVANLFMSQIYAILGLKMSNPKSIGLEK